MIFLLEHSERLKHVCAKLLQSSPALCDPMDCSPPSASVHGIFQARILEQVAMRLQGIFPTQRWNPHLSYLPLAPPEKPAEKTYTFI